MIAALAGGVGAAKLLRGLVEVVDPSELTVVVNVGDDVEFLGLRISPDIDIVTYTLAGLVDEEKGWGLRGDSFRCLEGLRRLGVDAWLKLGDLDLATHIYRTHLLKAGLRLSEACDLIRRALGVRSKILPATDDPLSSVVLTDRGEVHFEEYYVKHRCEPKVVGVRYAGADRAKPAPGVVEAVSRAEFVVICPSNPVVSIGPILAVSGVREALREAEGPVVAVSPIIAGRAVKGPAVEMMRALGYEGSAYGVAEAYRDFLDALVIDVADSKLKPRIEALGIKVVEAPVLMSTMSDKVRLASLVVGLARGLRARKEPVRATAQRPLA
ncbi:MAG: 2-phospho-L-lactate transferase [Candidatus Nezhaarchaeota archaeon]|nr:2-phospho-L-lactate transferase [Candidatus Nezhaarchaeota archaeon]